MRTARRRGVRGQSGFAGIRLARGSRQVPSGVDQERLRKGSLPTTPCLSPQHKKENGGVDMKGTWGGHDPIKLLSKAKQNRDITDYGRTLTTEGQSGTIQSEGLEVQKERNGSWRFATP